MEYDEDDAPQTPTLADIYWHYANRWAEWGMGVARSFGWKERKMILRCEAPNCMNEARGRAKFLDPRRGRGGELAYVTKHFCSQTCELAVMDELERQAQYDCLVS